MLSRFTLVLALGLGLVVGLLLLLGSGGGVALADPGIHYVAPGGDCGGATPCYGTVQAAVDAAAAGDTIKVAAGTYTDVHSRPAPPGYTGPAIIQQVAYISKTVTVRGGYTSDSWDSADPDANPAILDAGGKGRVLVITGAIEPAIEGLRLTGGDAAGLLGNVYGDDGGGGLYVLNATAVISGNQIYGNTADRGGGVQLQGSTATLRANEVRDNTAKWSAAGLALYRSPATLQDNHIFSNTALFAGGLMLHLSDATLRGNAILYNTATFSEGGGIYLTASSATLEGNVIRGNKTIECGGGLFNSVSDATLTNNVIADNHADRMGSGVCVRGGSPRLIHTTLACNTGSGGGLYAESTNSGVTSHVWLTNTILFGHTVGINVTADNSVILDATLWQANNTDWAGEGVIDHSNDYAGDPAFAADGYHLTIGSAARDKGADAGVATDIDGQPRPQGAGYDLGADELRVFSIYLPVTLKG